MRGGTRSWVLGAWSVLALLYLFIPIFVIVVFSFNDPAGRFNFTWQGFTLDHWLHPFTNPDLATAMKNSFGIAIISTLIAVALGTFMAMALVRYGFRGRSTVDFFVFLPLSTPEVVIGAALLALFLTASVSTGFATIVIARSRGHEAEWEAAGMLAIATFSVAVTGAVFFVIEAGSAGPTYEPSPLDAGFLILLSCPRKRASIFLSSGVCLKLDSRLRGNDSVWVTAKNPTRYPDWARCA